MAQELKSKTGNSIPKMSKPRFQRNILPSEILRITEQHDIQLSFFSAASSGEFRKIKRLLKLGADVNMPCSAGWTALHYAASEKQAKICAFLISNGANAFAKSPKGTTPLKLALERNSKLTIRAIEAGMIMPLVGSERSKEFVSSFRKCISGGV
jgi:ankyrin repeat protein